MRHLFTLFALATVLFAGPALAYQVDDTHSPGITDAILEHATAEALPLVLVAHEVTARAVTAPGITSATSSDACAPRVMTYAEIVECQRLRPPAWQPLRHEHRGALASFDTTMRDTRSQTWPIPSPTQPQRSSPPTLR